jgi:hypothetical protein
MLRSSGEDAVVLELTSSASCEFGILSVVYGMRTLIGNTFHKTGAMLA